MKTSWATLMTGAALVAAIPLWATADSVPEAPREPRLFLPDVLAPAGRAHNLLRADRMHPDLGMSAAPETDRAKG